MRRLIIIFSFLLLTFAVEGQDIKNARPFHRAVVSAGDYPEMVTNGAFDGITQAAEVNGAEWRTGVSWTIGSGVASYDDAAIGVLRQEPGVMVSQLEINTDYTLSFDVVSGGNLRFAFYSYSNGTEDAVLIAYTNYPTDHYDVDFTSPGVLNRLGIQIKASTTGDAGTLDNISLKKR